nr:MAG TPA: hypothetical protein [Bacteriophage sp.]
MGRVVIKKQSGNSDKIKNRNIKNLIQPYYLTLVGLFCCKKNKNILKKVDKKH